jgi:pyruvate/2-oxoglutarate dehydrogenase complex dihydrolipoamide acyltransferase (E2) component
LEQPHLFQNKQDGKYQGRKNKAPQGKIEKRIFGNGHSLPHFIAIIRVAIAEIKAARAAIKPEIATTHVAVFSFLSFFVAGGSFFLAII